MFAPQKQGIHVDFVFCFQKTIQTSVWFFFEQDWAKA